MAEEKNHMAPETCDACEEHESFITANGGLLALLGIGIGFLALVYVIAFTPTFAAATSPQSAAQLAAAQAANQPAQQAGEVQVIQLKATNSLTYTPNKIQVRAGTPVRVEFSAEANSGCGRYVVFPDFNLQLQAPADGSVVSGEFSPTKPGTYAFRCPMNMVRGTLTVL
jgi:plastocyanin